MYSSMIKTVKSKLHKSNQDNIFYKQVCKDIFLLGVFDGLSSSNYSEQASKICTKIFKKDNHAELIKLDPKQWFESILQEIIVAFNNFINNDESKQEMACTLCVNIIYNNKIINFNLGDSRTYLVSDNIVKCLTKDHTLRNYFEEKGVQQIHPKYIEHLESLTRYVDTKSNHIFKYDMKTYDYKPTDIIICCSDGLYKFFDLYSYDYSKNFSAKKFVKYAINQAIKNGSLDDISLGVHYEF